MWNLPEIMNQEIELDEDMAVMSPAAFNQLEEYDQYGPKRFEKGKIWKRRIGNDFYLIIVTNIKHKTICTRRYKIVVICL